MRHLRVHVVDSHTEGEPTRVVVSGGPDLAGPCPDRAAATPGPRSVADQLARFRAEFDWFRAAVVCEPRGADHLVGALLCPPADPRAALGVIFFNTSGFLGGCGHGTIGVARTLAHLGRLAPGEHTFETPVGLVRVHLAADSISLDNVTSYRLAARVALDLDPAAARALGAPPRVTGDIAWGGNWFFICHDHGLDLHPAHIDRLTRFGLLIRRALAANPPRALAAAGLSPTDIDHVELAGPSPRPGFDRRAFVLCPGAGGAAYDRSPCGTGTSAALAGLIEDGELREGQVWRVESIIGGAFTASARLTDPVRGRPAIVPTITGNAWITAESTLLIDPADPFRHGIPTPPATPTTP